MEHLFKTSLDLAEFLSGLEEYQIRNVVDSAVFDRGEGYFEDGLVHNLFLVQSDLLEAQVRGSAKYRVRLIKQNGSVLGDCNCPYGHEYGGPCKHIVAVLLEAMEQGGWSSDKKLPLDQVQDDWLDNVPIKDLRDFIRKRMHSDVDLRYSLESQFKPASTEELVERYMDQFLHNYEEASNRYDYIDYEGSYELSDKLSVLFNDLAVDFEQGNREGAIEASFKLFSEPLDEALGACDDSGGWIGDAISDGIENFRRWLGEAPKDKALAEQLWRVLKELFKRDVLSDLDPEWLGMLETLAEIKNDPNSILSLVDEEIRQLEQAEKYGWRRESLILVKAKKLKVLGRDKEREEWLRAHLSIDSVRELVVDELIAKERWDEALRMVENAVPLDEQEHFGWSRVWQSKKLEILERSGDESLVATHLQRLIVKGIDAWKNYLKLKNMKGGCQEWSDLVDGLVRKLREKSRDKRIVLEIFKEERRFNDLLDSLKGAHYRAIHNYIHELMQVDASFVAERAVSFFRERVYHTAPRSEYQRLANELKELADRGAKDIALGIIAEFQDKYPKRPAMLEELENVRQVLTRTKR